MGDAVMTTPALLRLRAAQPQAHISLLTPEKLADLWAGHPAIDAVLLIGRGENPWRVGRQLRGHGYEAGLVFPNSPRAALELWRGRIPIRVGYAASWRRWWLTHPLPPRTEGGRMRKRSAAEVRRLLAAPPSPAPSASEGGEAHHLYHYLHLAAALGADPTPIAPRLVVSEAEVIEAVRRFGLAPRDAPGRLWLGLNPGAEYGPAKRWPADRFAATALEVHRRLRCGWVVFGGPGEASLAEAIAGQIAGGAAKDAPVPVLNLAGQTTLRQLCALLRSCRALLTNDTGPMHVAAALGTPVVALFGSTAPALTGPGLPGDPAHRILRAPVPCSPCFRRECPVDLRCLTNLELTPVVEALCACVLPSPAG